MNLKNKIIMVTGAGGGIGAAIAETVCAYGGHAVVVDLNGQQNQVARDLVTRGFSAEAFPLDVTDSAATDSLVDEIVSRHGRLDGFVANAATNSGTAFLDHTDEEWRRVMSVNLDAVFYGARAAGRHMTAQKSGSIVLMSSICATKAVRPEVHAAYDVSKAAVGNLARTVGCEWGRSGVRVNAVGPGYTETPMLQSFVERNPDYLERWLDDMPIGRLLQPREIAGTVAFLLSDISSAINAQLIMADGGYSSS